MRLEDGQARYPVHQTSIVEQRNPVIGRRGVDRKARDNGMRGTRDNEDSSHIRDGLDLLVTNPHAEPIYAHMEC
jgi:hypothetical protein